MSIYAVGRRAGWIGAVFPLITAKRVQLCAMLCSEHLAPAAPWLDTVDSNHQPGRGHTPAIQQ